MSKTPPGFTERRRHHLYVTRNREYHFRDRTCVAVRDRATNHWLLRHVALKTALAAGVRFHPDGIAAPVEDGPEIGDAMYLESDGVRLVTSAVCGIGRPSKEDVGQYSWVGATEP